MQIQLESDRGDATDCSFPQPTPLANMSYRLDDGGKVFEYRMSIRTIDKDNISRLVEDYRKRDDVLEFRISPTGD